MTSKEKNQMYMKISKRANDMGILKGSMLTGLMDVEYADKAFNLKLLEFLNADSVNFAHDFIGIQNNIDRVTKKFGEFVPRFSGRKE